MTAETRRLAQLFGVWSRLSACSGLATRVGLFPGLIALAVLMGALPRAAGEVEVPETVAPFFRPPAGLSADLGPYKSPLSFNDGHPVRSAEDWRERRREILETWHEVMGPWPPLIARPEMQVLEELPRDGFTQRRVRLKIAPDRTTDGYLLVPDGPGPFPAMLVFYYESETAIGQGKGPGRDFADQLVRRGVAALSIGFEPRGIDLAMSGLKLQPLSYLAYVAANGYNALASLPEIDPARVGVMGHSYGGKWAMFASCLYEKFACGVWSDPGVVFDEARSNVNYWEPWYLGREPGRTRKRGVITPGEPPHRRLQAAGRVGARPARAPRADGPATVPRLRRLGGPARTLAGAEPRRRREQAPGS